MSERKPSAITQRCRAHNKAERLRAKIAEAREAEATRRLKHHSRIEALVTELDEAEEVYVSLGGTAHADSMAHLEDTPTVGIDEKI